VLAGGVAALLLKSWGWQGPLWVGGVLPILIGLVLTAVMPQSLEFLVRKGRDPAQLARLARHLNRGVPVAPHTRFIAGKEERTVLPTELFRDGRRLGTSLLWFAQMMNLMGTHLFQTWLPTMLVTLGFSVRAAVAGTAMSLVGGLFSAVIVGPLMDRFGPYRIGTALFVLSALSLGAVGLAAHAATTAVLVAAFFTNLSLQGIQKGINALTVYFYPSALRPIGIGFALGTGRFGGIAGPLAAGFLFTLGWSVSAVLYAMMVPALFGAAAVHGMQRAYGNRGDRSPSDDEAETRASLTRRTG
jgi:AAHS family 4-hydroxybenzoate transporter-like MFS transporter